MFWSGKKHKIFEKLVYPVTALLKKKFSEGKMFPSSKKKAQNLQKTWHRLLLRKEFSEGKMFRSSKKSSKSVENLASPFVAKREKCFGQEKKLKICLKIGITFCCEKEFSEGKMFRSSKNSSKSAEKLVLRLLLQKEFSEGKMFRSIKKS